MKFLITYLWGLLLLGGLPISLWAQEVEVQVPVEDTVLEASDEELYEENEEAEPVVFYKDTLDSMRNSKQFAYMSTLDSTLRNFKLSEPEPEPAPRRKSFFDLSFIKVLLWIIAIGAVLYIIFQLVAGRQQWFYRNKTLEHEENSGLQQVKKQPPLQLAVEAAARGDYRQAVRYQFVYILDLLAEKKLVVLQPYKTNAHYRQELAQKPIAADFDTIALQFEYVWYGAFPLNGEQYEYVAAGYRKFIETWL